MFLDEIFRPKTGDEVLMSAEDMRQARINRYGTDDITPVTAQDYSDKFNTELTPEEEAEFQSWAKENNRERDSYDYDIRGAWKELKSGSMSEDERGHLGDKYKKPNHPTFSDQSVYNGKDGVAGGTWSEVDGKTVFTPGRMLSKREAEYLSDYFRRVEPDVKLNLDGKIIKPKPLPGTGYEPGWFEGLGDTWLGMNAALAETKSAALTALSELPIGTEQEREGWLRAAEATRAYSKAHYEADPELMGAASQIIHGLFKTIPKAGGYMAALGPGAGAVAFGADMGISESQRLKDEGVDQKTRTSAGVMSFAANAIGLRLPGAFGSTRLMSTLYGAGANIGTDVAERKGIQLILENQNYGELAKQYEVSGADLAVSGIFGGVFGAIGYRSPQAKFDSEVAERRESLKKELMNAGRSEEEAKVEAGMTAPGEVLFAKQAGVDWKDIGYTVEWSDGTSATAGSYNQIVGKEGAYHLGWDVYSGMWTAEKMRSEGKTPEQIRLATGWEVGADGKWRFEIPDMKLKDDIYADLDKLDKEVKAELDEQLMSKEGAEYEAAEADVRKRRSNAVVKKTLGDIVDAPELFEAYPKLRYMTVEFGPLDRGVGAYYDPHEKLIRLSNEKPLLGLKDKDGIGVLVHEVQHAVQDIEGFTSGASPSSFPKAGEALAKDMSRLFELKKSSENYKKYREAAQAFEKSLESGESIDESMRAFDAARELPGNAEIFAEEQRLTDKWGMDADIQAAIRNASDDADPLFQKISKSDIGYQQRQYHRVAGEVEARNVTRRLGMSEDERRASTLESTEDVDRSEQQTRRGRPVRSEVSITDGVFNQAAYHGTAYTFDKFTLDHVGSGEGVQAHGWGLYFSLDRQIAEGYRSRVTSYRAVADELSRVFAGMDIKTREGMAKALYSAGDKLSPATRELLDALQEANWLGHENPMDAVQASLVAQIGKGKQTPRIKSAVEGLRNEEGNVYKVEIPDDDVMMHEELPLSQQPEAVQKAVHALLTDEDVRTQPDMRREKNGIEDVEPVSYAGKSLDEMTGKEILAALIAKYGSAKAASLALKEHGLKGYRYKGAIDGECAVVFDDAAIEMRNAIEKAKADGTGVVKLPDGRYEVKGSYDPKERKITLTPKADISTFAHEHSHWYLDMLMKVLGKEDIDPDLREAGEALLRSWGIKSVEDWNALGVEGQRKYQEQFAAWTEVYLSKGKSPVKGLEGLFERFGQWIVDLYKKALGLDPESAVKDRYKSETGEDLPPLSKEMEAVIRRMYGEQQKAKSVKPTPSQVAAARVVQAQRMNERKLTAPMANPNDPEAMDVAIKAQRQAAEQLNNGQAVDVGATLQGVQMNDVALTNSQKHFARAVQMGGDNSSLVVLQNRDRSKLAPVAQMNAIAANPQYGRVSFSRTTDTGAPIVSFGSMPDERYQGITDWVMDGGEKIPVTYAVVEADSVLTSNDLSGRAVDGYGDDPTRVHAVAGNGRLAGLTEAFERGTASQYVSDMMADHQQTGINPEAVGDLKRPVLVRFMPSEKVTTGFIDRSNQPAVLELSGSERAVQDARKLTTDKLKAYQFDENGEPTRATLDRFVNDIGEPSAIGGLIDGDGKPTEAAKARVMAALFYKAYRDPELTSLMSVETDKQGMKRVLNAMAAFAPHVIRIREMSGGAIDLGPAIVDAAHMLKSGEVPMDGALIDDVGPASRQMFELLYNNRKSAAAIGRVFNGFSDEITSSLGEGTGMLIGDPLDLADAMGFLRRAQNAEIQRQMDEGKTGLALMPDVDIVAVREALKAAEEAKQSAENLVSAMGEKVIQDAESKQNRGADDAQAKAEQEEAARIEEARARSLEVVGKSADMVRLENLAAEKPNQTYVLDDSGVQMTMEDVVKEMQRIEQEADIEAAGIGKAAECILRNGGIQQ